MRGNYEKDIGGLENEETPAVDPARPAPPHKGAGGGLPPPRGITAARPPFLPLRLDAWARLRGILGRLRGILGRLGTSKNTTEGKADFNIENEAKMKRPESPPEIIFGCQNATKTAFETALVLHHIFNALFLRS